ncbi:MAG: aspartate racemase, partial [Pyrinomonadaceae bacterium]
MKTVGLIGGLGPESTVDYYPEVFEGSGVDLVLPSSEEQEYIHDKYMNELLKNLFLPETRERFLAIAERIKTEEKIEGLILSGTEIPLLINGDQTNLPLLD